MEPCAFKRNDLVVIRSLGLIDMIKGINDDGYTRQGYTLSKYSGVYYEEDLIKIYDAYDNRLAPVFQNKRYAPNSLSEDVYTLEKFIKRFVRRNSIIRLWKKTDTGHSIIIGKTNGKLTTVCIDWEIIKGTFNKEEADTYIEPIKKDAWQAAYANKKVLYVADIVCDKIPEAINIVIEV